MVTFNAPKAIEPPAVDSPIHPSQYTQANTPKPRGHVFDTLNPALQTLAPRLLPLTPKPSI